MSHEIIRDFFSLGCGGGGGGGANILRAIFIMIVEVILRKNALESPRLPVYSGLEGVYEKCIGAIL